MATDNYTGVANTPGSTTTTTAADTPAAPVTPATNGDSGTPAPKPRSKRGFASMDPEAVRRIASLGGRAAHRSGNAHQFDSEEARSAGAKSRGRRKPE